uniref:Uncharacterized protein n=1 Tax=Schistosoma mansoni TaxID=6183 RepID=A0AA82N3E9_SCHMA
MLLLFTLKQKYNSTLSHCQSAVNLYSYIYIVKWCI